jgi:hypothetical protein
MKTYKLDKDSEQRIGTGIFRIWDHSLRKFSTPYYKIFTNKEL